MTATDLFCGAGGSSTGLLLAAEELGIDCDLLAINHWDVAIATHTANHPKVRHRCESVDGANPREIVPSGRLDLLVASPECTHHSLARGGKPKEEQSRATAWHILRWCEALNIRNVLIENVREFAQWGPLYPCTCEIGDISSSEHAANGCRYGHAIKEKAGTYYQLFLKSLRVMGYTVSERIVNAADYGDATTRYRLFIQARKGRRPRWPNPTHMPPGVNLDVFGSKTWRPARDIIDWTIEGKSIYDRKKPLAPATMARIMAGLRKYSGLPFLVPNYQERDGQSPRTHDVGKPLPTVAATGWHGLVEPKAYLVNMKGKSDACDVGKPMPTQTAKQHLYLAQPFLVVLRRHADARDIDDPVPAITAAGNHMAVCEGIVVTAGGPGGQGRQPRSVDDPLGTILSEDHHALVTPYVVVNRTHQDAHSVDDPLRALTTGGNMGLASACIVPTTHAGGEERTHDVDAPLPTVTGAHRGELALTEYLVKYYEGSDAVSVDEPLPTVTANYEHMGLVEGYLVGYHGNHVGKSDGDKRTKSIDDPIPTLDTSNRFGIAQPLIIPQFSSGAAKPVDEPLGTITTTSRGVGLMDPYLVKYNGTGGPQSVNDPLDTLTSRDRFALVSPEFAPLLDKGDIVGYLDIRFRMLQPHELAAAMGFPVGYQFSGNREARVKQIGNAVCVNLAKSLCKAILEDLGK